MHTPAPPAQSIVGRGPLINPPNRFETLHVEPDPDCPPEEQPNPRTQFFPDGTESLLTKNDSPDVGFVYGFNAYRGCEHGCAYCYARPYHEYLGWSSGLDFETKIMVKLRAPELLHAELCSPRWQPQTIGMSGVTDCYQPAERQFRLTRRCLEVCAQLRHPIALITKNALVTRDRDVLAELARHQCVFVNFSVTTLDTELCGKLEPRAARPAARLRAMRELSDAGIPTGVMVAPVIPGLTEHELPAIIDAAAAAGAKRAGYIVLRLPHAVKDVFTRWLEDHEPGKKQRVLERVRSMRGGKLCSSSWDTRMSGQGVLATHIRAMFDVAVRRAGLNQEPCELTTANFRRPGEQLSFDLQL